MVIRKFGVPALQAKLKLYAELLKSKAPWFDIVLITAADGDQMTHFQTTVNSMIAEGLAILHHWPIGPSMNLVPHLPPFHVARANPIPTYLYGHSVSVINLRCCQSSVINHQKSSIWICAFL